MKLQTKSSTRILVEVVGVVVAIFGLVLGIVTYIQPPVQVVRHGVDTEQIVDIKDRAKDELLDIWKGSEGRARLQELKQRFQTDYPTEKLDKTP